ncbi:hypothetical protein Hanom_Chr04g00376421 [Helianthus anomalus]
MFYKWVHIYMYIILKENQMFKIDTERDPFNSMFHTHQHELHTFECQSLSSFEKLPTKCVNVGKCQCLSSFKKPSIDCVSFGNYVGLRWSCRCSWCRHPIDLCIIPILIGLFIL